MSAAGLWVVGMLTVGIDGLVWGVAASILHRWLWGSGRRWLAAALGAALVFVVWDQWVFAEFVHWAGFPRTHAEPARLVEVAAEVGATLVGFRGGRALLGAIVRRERETRAPAAGPAPGESPRSSEPRG